MGASIPIIGGKVPFQPSSEILASVIAGMHTTGLFVDTITDGSTKFSPFVTCSGFASHRRPTPTIVADIRTGFNFVDINGNLRLFGYTWSSRKVC